MHSVDPPSPDYVPSLEEPEQAPLSSNYVSGPEYPEYLAPSDKEVPVEDQPYATADSPITLSSGYIAAMHIRAQTPIPFLSEAVVDRLLVIPTPPPSPLTLLSSPLPRIPSPLFSVPSPPTTSPPFTEAPLGYKASGCYQGYVTASKKVVHPKYEIGESSSALTAKSTRGFRIDYGFVSTLDAEIRRDPDREIDSVTTVRQDTNEIYKRLNDAQDDRSLMSGQLNLLRKDRHSHARTARLIESEARASREACVQSMDASDTSRSEKMPPRKAPRTRHTPATATTPMTDAAMRALISRGIADALAEHEIQRNNNFNGDRSQGSRSGITRLMRPTHECTYTDFLKLNVQSRTKLRFLLAPFMVLP
nr:hypothetical protein [Tanacetum cinerariifolium]